MNIKATNSNENIKESYSSSSTKQTDNNDKLSFTEEYNKLLEQGILNNYLLNPNQIISMVYAKENSSLRTENLNGLRTDFNYDTMSISKEDALFFNSLVEKTDYVLASDSSSFQTQLIQVANQESEENIKSAEVSKALMNLIEEAYKTQKPARIDFDNNVSVIIRISREGKISADFIPGDKAVEEYLRNNIGYLKSSLEQQNIEYEDIMYKPYKNNSKQNQNRRNGGNNNE